MNAAMLADAENNGTRSWEVIIWMMLALALLSALCARAGDVVRSGLYTGNECLCWQDVHIVGKEDAEGRMLFHATFTLRFEKGDK